MDNLDNNFGQATTPQPTGLRITTDIEQDWLKTSKWVMFFAVLGFIVFGIYALVTLFAGIMLGASAGGNSIFPGMGALGAWLIVFMLVFLAFTFFLNLYQLRFANGITRAINFSDEAALERAWLNMRNYFRLLGISVIVFLVMYGILIVALGAAGMSGMLGDFNGL